MPNIQFKIHHVEIEQFAAIQEPRKENVTFNITVKPGCNINLKAVAISVDARFLEGTQPFLMLKTNSFFEIRPETWEELTDKETGNVIIPESFIVSLAQISISQSRGVLCAKTEATPFAKYLLPIVNVDQFGMKGDMVILPDGGIDD